MILSIEVIPCCLIQRNVTFLGSYGLTILVHTNLCGSIFTFLISNLTKYFISIIMDFIGQTCAYSS